MQFDDFDTQIQCEEIYENYLDYLEFCDYHDLWDLNEEELYDS